MEDFSNLQTKVKLEKFIVSVNLDQNPFANWSVSSQGESIACLLDIYGRRLYSLTPLSELMHSVKLVWKTQFANGHWIVNDFQPLKISVNCVPDELEMDFNGLILKTSFLFKTVQTC